MKGNDYMRSKSKVVIGLLTTLTLSACSSSPINTAKTYPSVEVPYEIVNKEIEEYKNEGLDNFTDYQSLEAVNVREITQEENEEFLNLMTNNTLNDLTSEYVAVEFDFGTTTRINKNNQTLYEFDENSSFFVYDDEILNNDFYQLKNIDNKELFLRYDEEKDEEVAYGEVVEDFEIVTIVNEEFVKKGLQFKTVINDEVIYIDIE